MNFEQNNGDKNNNIDDIVRFKKIQKTLTSRIRSKCKLVETILISAIIVLPLSASAQQQQQQQVNAGNNNNGNNPIKHIVVIMQENHTFDNYFGTYPGANGIPKDICMPLNPNQSDTSCVKPFLTTNNFPPDIPHEYQPSHIAYDNGKMDGYMVAENKDTDTMSYYDNNTIPNYWELAKYYVLADNFFSSVLSYSLSHLFIIVCHKIPKLRLLMKSRLQNIIFLHLTLSVQ